MATPKLRFKGFHNSWGHAELGRFAEINPNTGSLPDSFYYIDLESVVKGRFTVRNKIFKVNAPSRAQRNLATGDVLFQTVRPYQQNNLFFNYTDEKFVASTGYAQIRTKYDSKFLYFLLHTEKFLARVLNKCEGGNYPAINTANLKKIIVEFPAIEEQQKIADFLTSVDEKINLLKKKKELLEQYKKGVMQKIFSQELRFKDKDGKDFPEWKTTLLKNHCKIYDGTHQTPTYVNEGIPFYSVEHLTANNFSSTKYITEEVFIKENERVKLERGDILMTRIGDIGTSKLIDWDVNASFYVSLALLKCNSTISSKYLNQYIKSPYFQNELWKKTIHVAFPKKINLGEIGVCSLKVPSIDEQQKIADFLTALDDKIDLVEQQINKTELWKKGLLQQMFV